MNYIDWIRLVRTLPCLAEPGRIIVIGKPSRPLQEVFPYLATLPGVIGYNPEQCTLAFRREPGFITLKATEIQITQVKDLDEAVQLLAALADSINAVWNHRAELAPVKASKRAALPLDIWRLLPQTNCRKCGERTCLAFAVALIQHKRAARECPFDNVGSGSAERLAALNAIL